jgi:hypothetical protein
MAHPDAPLPRGGRPHASRSLREAAAVLGVLVVLGALSGVVWWALVSPAEFTKVAKGGAMGEVELGRQFARDGWYAVIALVAGLLAGVAVLRWRPRTPVLGVGLLLLGCCGAAAVMAEVGHLLGPGDPAPLLAAAKVGDKVPEQLRVDTFVTYLAWPFGALLGALLMLLGPDRSSAPVPRADVGGESAESVPPERRSF